MRFQPTKWVPGDYNSKILTIFLQLKPASWGETMTTKNVLPSKLVYTFCIKLVIKIQKWKTLLPPSFCKSHCIPMKIPSPESKTLAVVEVPHKICFVAIYSLYKGGYFGWMNEPKINISLMNRRKRPDNSKKEEQPGQCLIDGCNFLQCFHWDNGYVH